MSCTVAWILAFCCLTLSALLILIRNLSEDSLLLQEVFELLLSNISKALRHYSARPCSGLLRQPAEAEVTHLGRGVELHVGCCWG